MMLAILFNIGVHAQTNEPEGLPPEVMAWTKSTLDKLSYKRYKSLKEAMIDNDFYIPEVFRGGIFPKLNFNTDIGMTKPNLPSPYSLGDKYTKNMFSSYYIKKSLEDAAYMEMLKNPFNFKYTLDQLPGGLIKSESIEKTVNGVKITVEAATVAPEAVNSGIKFIPDRKYWISSFSADLKFSQNKTSDNWVSGKIDNMNIYENIVIGYNYERDKVTLKNTLSNLITLSNAPNDSIHFYALGSNELRFRSVFGLKAIGNWSYTVSGEFFTPMLHKFKTNSNKLNSTFLSPYTINIGIGMTFAKKIKYKAPNKLWDITLSVEPLSFKYTYSKNKEIDLAAYFPKSEDGTFPYIFRSFGSNFILKNTVNFNKYVDLTSRLYYFTNYERMIGEFENKLNIALSRYFSTMFYIYFRYDDGVAKSPKSNTYLQVNEMFTFGFSYKW
jgi:hypothetical protein